MKVTKNILSMIGNTPLIKLQKVSPVIHANVFAKCEFRNPSGSIKDRIALEMIECAEKENKLKPGSTIVEASTGNTGIALSFVGNIKGYKVRIFETIPGKMSEERVKIMKSFGAEVTLISPDVLGKITEDSVSGAEVELPGRLICKELEEKQPDVWWARQFSNPANVTAHHKTGKEIIDQVDGKIDAFIAAIGTGGTLMGIAEILKKENPKTKVIGIQPASSKIPIEIGKEYPSSEIMGGIITEMLKKQLVDSIVTVGDEKAVEMTHKMWRKEGVFCGVSSGANVLVAINEAQKLGRSKNVVTILPDHGDRYLSEEHFIT
jgi:cysteine synthase